MSSSTLQVAKKHLASQSGSFSLQLMSDHYKQYGRFSSDKRDQFRTTIIAILEKFRSEPSIQTLEIEFVVDGIKTIFDNLERDQQELDRHKRQIRESNAIKVDVAVTPKSSPNKSSSRLPMEIGKFHSGKDQVWKWCKNFISAAQTNNWEKHEALAQFKSRLDSSALEFYKTQVELIRGPGTPYKDMVNFFEQAWIHHERKRKFERSTRMLTGSEGDWARVLTKKVTLQDHMSMWESDYFRALGQRYHLSESFTGMKRDQVREFFRPLIRHVNSFVEEESQKYWQLDAETEARHRSSAPKVRLTKGSASGINAPSKRADSQPEYVDLTYGFTKPRPPIKSASPVESKSHGVKRAASLDSTVKPLKIQRVEKNQESSSGNSEASGWRVERNSSSSSARSRQQVDERARPIEVITIPLNEQDCQDENRRN